MEFKKPQQRTNCFIPVECSQPADIIFTSWLGAFLNVPLLASPSIGSKAKPLARNPADGFAVCSPERRTSGRGPFLRE
jgi:hypothetical protein